MELWIELEPSFSLEELVGEARRSLGCADYVDLPDQPLGVKFSSPIAAAAVSARLGSHRVVPHVRTVDVQLHTLKSIVKTLIGVGIRRVVLLRGDPIGSVAGGVPPEAALMAVERYRARYSLKAGLIISLRKGLQRIRERLSAGPDFALVLNLSRDNIGVLREASGMTPREGFIVYLVVATEKSLQAMSGKITTLTLTPGEALNLALKASELPGVSGFLISSPRDPEARLKLCEELREHL